MRDRLVILNSTTSNYEEKFTTRVLRYLGDHGKLAYLSNCCRVVLTYLVKNFILIVRKIPDFYNVDYQLLYITYMHGKRKYQTLLPQGPSGSGKILVANNFFIIVSSLSHVNLLPLRVQQRCRHYAKQSFQRVLGILAHNDNQYTIWRNE